MANTSTSLSDLALKNIKMNELQEKIIALKKEKNAVLLAHYYMTGDIQDIADYLGDSLKLAQDAYNTEADIIIFAGVHFMAETAKIINPTKKVLLPDMEAGCSLADSCPADDLAKMKAQFPDHKVISYINCSTDVKTHSDVIVTSSNALKIVKSYPEEEKIIFAPDKNLGAYINNMTGRDMMLWDGSCEVHDILSSEAIIQLKVDNPDAKLIAHPECKAVVLEMADFIGSTTALLNYSKTNPAQTFIVATETGILHQMQKDSPEKNFIIVPTDETCSCNDCPYMKKITLENIYQSLIDEQPEILLEDGKIEKAKAPILKMLDLSK